MKNFNTVTNGYDKNEVNAFVTEVTNEYEDILNKLKSKEKEIAFLQSELSRYKDIETTMNKAVLIAEDSSNQIKRIAKEEANLIIDNAKKNASQIVNDALIKAEKTEIEVDNLRRSIKLYKARIKEVVSEQLTMVDDLDNIKLDERD